MSSTSPTAVSAVREHVIHEALYRPVLFAGAAPEFVLMEVAVVFGLVFIVGLHMSTIVLAILYGTVGHAVAVWVSSQDPQVATVYLRSLAGKDFYAPHAASSCSVPAVRTSLPRGR